MPGKTISAHADEETAKLVERLARLEDRSPSQIAAAALALYVRLPAVAHDSLRYVLAEGTEDDYARMTREIARAMLDAKYEISYQQVLDTMQVDGERVLSEEEILAEAVRETAPPPPAIRRTRRDVAADTESRSRRRSR